MQEGEVGLAGIGRSGEWIVELDENGAQQLAVSVSHPRVCLQLPPTSDGEIRRLLQCIENVESGAFGSMFGAAMSLEFDDDVARFKLCHGDDLLELSVSMTELAELAVALREAILDAEL